MCDDTAGRLGFGSLCCGTPHASLDAAEGKLDGAACLGSGYDFKAEMSLSEDSSGITYDQIILHYWKEYVNKHKRILAKGGIDLKAVKSARSLPVSTSLHSLLTQTPSTICRKHCPHQQSKQHKAAKSHRALVSLLNRRQVLGSRSTRPLPTCCNLLLIQSESLASVKTAFRVGY